jgi:hypothetical protein
MDLDVEIGDCDEGVVQLIFVTIFNFDNVSTIALCYLYVYLPR